MTKTQLIKRWRDFEKEFRDLDYKRSVLCRDTMDFCNGDRNSFVTFCALELDHSQNLINENLRRIAALKVIATSEEWNAIGGFKAIERHLDLPAEDLARAATIATKEHRALASAVRMLNEASMEPKPARAKPRAVGAMNDATVLARFIVERGIRLPPHIAEIVRLYAPQKIRA